jgi:hypothetical protein
MQHQVQSPEGLLEPALAGIYLQRDDKTDRNNTKTRSCADSVFRLLKAPVQNMRNLWQLPVLGAVWQKMIQTDLLIFPQMQGNCA